MKSHRLSPKCLTMGGGGRLRRVAATWREHLQIAVGNVSKKKHLRE